MDKGRAVEGAGRCVPVDKLRRGRPTEERGDELSVVAVPQRVHLRVRGDQRLDVFHGPLVPPGKQVSMGGHGQQCEFIRIFIKSAALRHELQQRLYEILPADCFIGVDHRQHICKQPGIQRVIRQHARIQQIKIRARGQLDQNTVALLFIGIGDRYDLNLILRICVVEAHDGVQQLHRYGVGQSAVCLRIGVHLASGISEAAKTERLLDRYLSLFRADQSAVQKPVLSIRVIHVPQRVFQAAMPLRVAKAQSDIHPAKQQFTFSALRVG